MKTILFSVFALVSQYGKGMHDFEEEDHVIVLTDPTWKDAMQQFPKILVQFQAHWCGPCIEFAPKYSEVAKILKEEDIYIAKYDPTQWMVPSNLEILHYPTFLWMVNGQPLEYTGTRKVEEMVEWVIHRNSISVDEVECDDLKERLPNNQISSIFFGDDFGELSEIYTKIAPLMASENSKMKFFIAPEECAEEYEAEAPGLSIYHSKEDKFVHFEGDEEESVVRKFIYENIQPDSSDCFDKSQQYQIESNSEEFCKPESTVIKFAEQHLEKVFEKNKKVIVLFSNDDDNSQLHQKFDRIAQKLQQDALFVTSRTDDADIQHRFGELVGVYDEYTPTIRMHVHNYTMWKYSYREPLEDISVQSIAQFIKDEEDGNLIVNFKSQLLPKNNDGNLKILVGQNWQEIVMDINKDVFVLYYAPWCGHCVKINPIWEELADKVAQIDNLTIAKFDITTNEIRNLKLKGYPTIKFYPMHDKDSQTFRSYRELENLIEFLEENSKAYQDFYNKNNDQKKEFIEVNGESIEMIEL